MPESDFTSVIPAQLSFLAIYNPSLGATDETINDQVVFYTSKSDRLRSSEDSTVRNDDKVPSDKWNERLRQIGLAQGMVNFARNFSEGKAVDYVETEKSHVILHELEENWWILASIDLTRLPVDAAGGASSRRDASDIPQFLYSSREVCPPHLLIQQLRRAHSIFLLHHGLTLEALYDHVGRPIFCTFLERFWGKFAWTWEVLLNGNPAVDMYNGIKLSAGGELGVGVGEEEWGSGEREVLEDFVLRTDGLVDLVVSRFGDPYIPIAQNKPRNPANQGDDESQWLGLDICPRPSDGVIFSGLGAISRPSLVRVSQWMEWIYRYGYDAYGIDEDPTSPRRRKRRKRQRGRLPVKEASIPAGHIADSQLPAPDSSFSPGIPRPLVMGAAPPPQDTHRIGTSRTSSESSLARIERGGEWMGIGSETFVKYLTLGYGSAWSFPSGTPSSHPRVDALKRENESQIVNKDQSSLKDTKDIPEESGPKVEHNTKPREQPTGGFIIGLRKDTADLDDESPTGNATSDSTDKIVQRTLHVHRTGPSEPNEIESVNLRVVIYVNQPFMYTFFFEPETPSLADSSLYQSIHHQLGPLQKPLSHSTSPANAVERISISENTLDFNSRFSAKSQSVYDLVYDPSNLTIRSSIPNIPDLGSYAPEAQSRDPSATPWSRVESLSIHHRLLSTYAETRSRPLEVERTCKTSRGWWIVWVRLSETDTSNQDAESSSTNGDGDSAPHPHEAFLIRKSSDHVSSSGNARGGSGTRFFRDLGGASSRGSSTSRSDIGPGKLVEGLGLDARRYIENILSLNR